MDSSAIGPLQRHERDAVRALYREYRAFIESLYTFRPFDDDVIAQLPDQTYVFRLPVPHFAPHPTPRAAPHPTHVAGCITLRHHAPGIAEVKRLYVAPAARGQQAGRRLTEYAIGQARHQGYARLRLDTLEAMTSAIALYLSLGFEEIGNYHQRPLPHALFFELAL